YYFLLRRPAPTEISTLSLHDALPILVAGLTLAGDGLRQAGALALVLHQVGPGRVEVDAAAGTHHLGVAHQRRRRRGVGDAAGVRSEEHTSELQSPCNLVCRLLLEKKK